MDLKQMIARQQEILNVAKAEHRDLSAEEKHEFDDLQRDIDFIKNSPVPNEGQKNNNETAEKAAEAERTRITTITSMCRDFNINPDEYVKDATMTVDKCRAAVLDHLKKNGAPASVKVTEDESDKYRAAAADALQMRCGMTVEKPADGAMELRGMSLRDLAIETLSREGLSTDSALRKMSSDDLFSNLMRQFYNPTAAFPAILDQTIRKNIVKIYNEVPTTFQDWCTKGSVSDFKQTPDHNYIIGGGAFQKVPENGELKASKPSTELLPQRKIDTYGTQFSMSRQAFINDDIGFLSQIPGVYSSAAKREINEQVYSLVFNNNAEIYDGKILFSSDHGNIIDVGSAPSLATINSLMLKMQAQKDPFGKAINISPRMLVLPIGYGLSIDTLLHATNIGSAVISADGSTLTDAHYNPMAGKGLTYVEDATLNALAGSNAAPWFMVANPLTAKSIQVDYLNGQETPTIRRSEQPGTLGFVWDIWLDWGITVIDYRGIARNNGIAISI